jgi:hypothetical protein
MDSLRVIIGGPPEVSPGAAASRRWRAAHLEEARAAARESVRLWRSANPGVSREANRLSRERMKAAVFDHYGRSCACCRTARRLTIDHAGGGGKAHRVALFGRNQAGAQFYSWLVRNGFPDGYQTLCLPCNASKGDGASCALSHSGVSS